MNFSDNSTLGFHRTPLIISSEFALTAAAILCNLAVCFALPRTTVPFVYKYFVISISIGQLFTALMHTARVVIFLFFNDSQRAYIWALLVHNSCESIATFSLPQLAFFCLAVIFRAVEIRLRIWLRMVALTTSFVLNAAWSFYSFYKVMMIDQRFSVAFVVIHTVTPVLTGLGCLVAQIYGRRKHRNLLAKVPLGQRYEMSKSLEIASSLLPPCFCYAFFKIAVLGVVWAQGYDFANAVLYDWLTLMIGSLNALAFPSILTLTLRPLRWRILSALGIEGTRLSGRVNTDTTGDSYFRHLEKAWR